MTCAECRRPQADLLCDGPLPAGVVHRRSSVSGADTTCSRPICRVCTTRTEDGRDFCGLSACQAAAQEADRA